MAHGPFIRTAERAEIRRRIVAGERPTEVARALGRALGSIHQIIRQEGGRPPPRAPRSPLRLSLAEREEISRGLRAGRSLRAIAADVHRAPSTVSREVAVNGGASTYRAWHAECVAIDRARRPKARKLLCNRRLCERVELLLRLRWSPAQIAARLRHDHSGQAEMWVSPETIYQSLFVQGRGALRAELARCLRSGRTQRRPRGRGLATGRGQIPGTSRRRQRPTREVVNLRNSSSATWPSAPASYACEVNLWNCLLIRLRPRRR